jgi:hypothetical protein
LRHRTMFVPATHGLSAALIPPVLSFARLASKVRINLEAHPTFG